MKLKLLLLFFVFLFPFVAFADSWKNLKQGDEAAQEFLNKLDQKKSEAGSHPFYNGNTPKEAKYTNSDLTGKPQGALTQDPAAQMVIESSNTRPHFKIDPQKDPLIVRSEKLMENPLTEIGGKETQSTASVQGGTDETLVCEEAGDDATHTCKAHLIVTLKETWGPEQQGCFEIKSFHLYGSWGGRGGILSWKRGMDAAGEKALRSYISTQNNIPLQSITTVNAPTLVRYVTERGHHWKHTYPIYRITYAYRQRIKEPSFSWNNHCGALEAKADEGQCHYVSKTCSIGKQTRIIGGIPVTQDCWEGTFTYNCSYPAKDDCGPLRAKGCVQIASTCKKKVGNACVVYTQTYQCKGKSQTKYEITGGQTPFCLDGNCRDQSWEVNNEMMSSLSQLSILKELQGKFKNGSFFKGETRQCSKYILNFKDCCGSGKGWGKNVGLGGCKANEKLLSNKRKAGLCHYVGTYCDKKILGKCVKKKSSYCCFGSKLLKAFHEQGRPQIGLGWGEPKSPLCRGFTINEIQRIDFSKIDFSEVFEDLMKSYNPTHLQGVGKHIGERLETIKKGLAPNTKQQTKQRNEG